MSTYKDLGTQIGELVDEKNAAYGSSFAKSGDFLRLLYPTGIRPAQMEDALLLVRIFDKQMRIATDQDAFGESPFQDIAGYGLLGAKRHKERRATCQGSASIPDATKSSKEMPDSTASTTNELTTTNERRSIEPALSQPQKNSSHLPVFVLARTAQEIANQSVVDRARNRNVGEVEA